MGWEVGGGGELGYGGVSLWEVWLFRFDGTREEE